ncbi:unnamed protein product [Pieris brassicae]|uniref:Uncharacterized protein n=1 Tax=Pieris brassicae TaxID=7116 RepID=A0A9P0XAC4_PIEBR|nr:unnamed protein product [Pieris brassicae]
MAVLNTVMAAHAFVYDFVPGFIVNFYQNNVRFTKKIIEPVPPEHARKRGVNKSNWKCEKKRRERVCKTAFIKILQVGKDRVTGILQRSYKDGGSVTKENRGGNHKKDKYAQRQRSVMAFIESIEAAEPHYCRAKSFVSLYLPPELNIKKLWKMYEEQIASTPYLKVKQSFFRQIFNRKYNVGFGSPLKDTCSRCSELKREIESTNGQEKQIHITQKRLHSLKAKAFYDLLKKEKRHSIAKKTRALPKLPDQAAYFSRQFNMSNFTVVIGTSKSALDNVRTYYWCENEHAKSSSEIASAVFDTLISLDIPSDKTRVRLFAEGSKEDVSHLRPVRDVGVDIEVYDWKNEVNNVCKPPGSWHFKFNACKRYCPCTLTQGEENYRSEYTQPKYVTKKTRSCAELEPVIRRKGNKINIKKIADVSNLLSKHVGEDWRTIESLAYYRDIEVNNDNSEEREDLVCVPLEENENCV